LQGLFGFALPAQDHEIVGVGHDARAEASERVNNLRQPAFEFKLGFPAFGLAG
jgi:hypothetical protein